MEVMIVSRCLVSVGLGSRGTCFRTLGAPCVQNVSGGRWGRRAWPMRYSSETCRLVKSRVPLPRSSTSPMSKQGTPPGKASVQTHPVGTPSTSIPSIRVRSPPLFDTTKICYVCPCARQHRDARRCAWPLPHHRKKLETHMQTVHILEAHETQRNALPLRYNILSKVDDLCGLAVDVVEANGRPVDE